MSNEIIKTFDENYITSNSFKSALNKVNCKGTRTEYLPENQSKEKLLGQFALRAYTQKEFQVMGNIVSYFLTAVGG